MFFDFRGNLPETPHISQKDALIELPVSEGTDE